MAKGGDFEREVCSILSSWWTDGKRDDIFYRSNASGARFTQRKKSGKDTAYQGGDVSFTDPIGEPLIKAWNIEVKTGYGGKEIVKDASGKIIKKIQLRWDILDLLDSSQKKTVFETMWEQCCRDANLTGRLPVLIFRRNQRKVCVTITSDFVRTLMKFYGSPRCKRIRYDYEDFHLYILPFKDFLEWLHDFEKFLC